MVDTQVYHHLLALSNTLSDCLTVTLCREWPLSLSISLCLSPSFTSGHYHSWGAYALRRHQLGLVHSLHGSQLPLPPCFHHPRCWQGRRSLLRASRRGTTQNQLVLSNYYYYYVIDLCDRFIYY